MSDKPTKYFATGYSREELKAMHPTIDLEPEWVKCPQCGRENSKETWQKFGGKCPNCHDLFDKESSAEGTSEQAPQVTPRFPDCNVGTAHECCVARMKRLEKEQYGQIWEGTSEQASPTPDRCPTCGSRHTWAHDQHRCNDYWHSSAPKSRNTGISLDGGKTIHSKFKND